MRADDMHLKILTFRKIKRKRNGRAEEREMISPARRTGKTRERDKMTISISGTLSKWSFFVYRVGRRLTTLCSTCIPRSQTRYIYLRSLRKDPTEEKPVHRFVLLLYRTCCPHTYRFHDLSKRVKRLERVICDPINRGRLYSLGCLCYFLPVRS